MTKQYQPQSAKGLAKQSVSILRLLIQEDTPLSALRISQLLGISQQNVYRAARPLVERRLVTSGRVAGVVYRAREMAQARRAYATFAEQEFQTLFGDAYDSRQMAADAAWRPR